MESVGFFVRFHVQSEIEKKILYSDAGCRVDNEGGRWRGQLPPCGGHCPLLQLLPSPGDYTTGRLVASVPSETSS